MELDDTERSNTLGANPAPTETDVAMNEELPSPAYVPLNQHSISEQEGTEESKYNIDSWNLTRLQDYIDNMKIACHSKQNINQLKKIVCRHAFDKLITDVPVDCLHHLLSKYQLEKQNGMKRKEAQLRAHFLRTRDPYILKYMEENCTLSSMYFSM